MLLLACAGCSRSSPPAPAAPPDQGAAAKAPVPNAPKPADEALPPCNPSQVPVTGRIEEDTVWCGLVDVQDHVVIAPVATVTVLPGTTVRFAPSRDPWAPDRRLRLRVEGRLMVKGSPDKLVRFTSGHQDPLNGDWATVEFRGKDPSRVAYAVFEYGQRGIWVEGSEVTLDHVVVRFNNWAGVALRRQARAKVQSSRIYANGYNCLDVKEESDLVVSGSYLANCAVVGIHVGQASARLDENLFQGHSEAVYLGPGARATLISNRFTAPKGCVLSCADAEVELTMAGNVYDGVPDDRALCCPKVTIKKGQAEDPAPQTVFTGLSEGLSSYLDYIPGTPGHDIYPYVLPDAHKTRKVLHKIGDNIGLTWSVAWDGKHIWTANVDNEVMRLDPQSGEVLQRFTGPGSHPMGLTFFKGRLWINDFNTRKVYAVDPDDGTVQTYFASPDPEGGCQGMTNDGENLCLLGWFTPKLYRVSPEGKLVDAIPAPRIPIGAGIELPVSGGLAWDGRAFWAPADRLVRFDTKGKVLGWIHSTSARVYDMTWDGQALWTTQRTNETWSHLPRLFRVKPLKLQKD